MSAVGDIQPSGRLRRGTGGRVRSATGVGATNAKIMNTSRHWCGLQGGWGPSGGTGKGFFAPEETYRKKGKPEGYWTAISQSGRPQRGLADDGKRWAALDVACRLFLGEKSLGGGGPEGEGSFGILA